jgi:hypothetical protein
MMLSRHVRAGRIRKLSHLPVRLATGDQVVTGQERSTARALGSVSRVPVGVVVGDRCAATCTLVITSSLAGKQAEQAGPGPGTLGRAGFPLCGKLRAGGSGDAVRSDGWCANADH